MNRRRKNNIVIGTLCAVLVLMGVGYAILSTTLNIGGTANIKGDFDIHFTRIQRSSSTITDTTLLSTMDNGTGITDGTNNHEGTFTAVLQKPTDYVIYDVTVANTGSIDGYLTFSFGDTNNNFDYYKDFYSVEFIRDDVTPNIKADILQNGTFTDNEVLVNTTGTRTYKIKVMFKESATSFPDVTTNGDFECTLNLTYSQQAPSGGNSGSSEVCYTPLNEAKQLRKITTDGTSLGTATASNLSVGDLVGYGTSDISSNEQFYVLENNNGQLKLLSRYLINVGDHAKPWDNCSRNTTGLQDPNIGYTASRHMNDMKAEKTLNGNGDAENGFLYGSLPFSSTAFWWDSSANNGNGDYATGYSQHGSIYANSGIKTYVDSYVSTLNTLGLNATSGTVLSIQELGGICNNTDFTVSNYDVSGCPNYVFETSYWLGSAGTDNFVWHVYADGRVDYGFVYDEDLGVRPVINVSLS